MALVTIFQIIAAAVITVLSSSTMKALRGRRVENTPLLSTADEIHQQKQNERVLFEFDKQQRESLLLSTHQMSRDASLDGIVDEIRETFDREGYVIVRGLLSDETIDNLDSGGSTYLKQTQQAHKNGTFAAFKFAPVFFSPPSNNDNSTADISENSTSNDEDWEKLKAFRETSMESSLPHFVAKVLLNMEPTQSLRILKDVFLAKSNEEDYCGWHVDDILFWPTSAHATSDLPGVNTWIAMDDIPSSRGGGLAVAPRSHRAEWKYEAYEAIGSPIIFPEEGHQSWEDIFGYNGTTCSMTRTAPDIDSEIDRNMKVFDFQRGDILLHTRWLFHRSVPLTDEGKKYFNEKGETPMIRRYSIRYEVGDAQLLEPSMEPSVVLNPQNGGKTLDEVSTTDLPWYPKCWPEIDSDEVAQMHEIVNNRLPAYETQMVEIRKKVVPLLSKKNEK